MTEGDDTELDIVIPEHFDYIIFAEDFVDSVMVRNNRYYNVWKGAVPFRKFVNNPFNETIRRVIDIFTTDVQECNVEIFNKMWRNLEVTSSNYTEFVNNLDQDMFQPNIFDAEVFLQFCTGVSHMAALFYNNAVIIAPLIAKSRIIKTLKNRMTADGWNAIHNTAEMLVNTARVPKHYRIVFHFILNC